MSPFTGHLRRPCFRKHLRTVIPAFPGELRCWRGNGKSVGLTPASPGNPGRDLERPVSCAAPTPLWYMGVIVSCARYGQMLIRKSHSSSTLRKAHSFAHNSLSLICSFRHSMLNSTRKYMPCGQPLGSPPEPRSTPDPYKALNSK